MTPNVIVWDNIRVPWRTAADKDTLTDALNRKLHNGNNTPKHGI